MKFSHTLVVLSLGLGLHTVCAHAAPVGMAASVKGQVTVQQGTKKSPLRLLGRLEPGSTIACGPGSSAVIVLFKDGSRFQVGANKKVTVGASAVGGAERLAALSGPSAGAVELLGNARVGAVLARAVYKPRRLAPDSPSYYQTATPTLKWVWDVNNPNVKPARYTFTLFDESDNIVWSTSTTEPNATYPSNALPLAERKPYVWKLSGFNAAGKSFDTSYWGFITVLSPQDARDLEASDKKLTAQAAATPADQTPLLLLADTYRYYGVLNKTVEVLTDYPLAGSPEVEEAENSIYDSMSPLVRILSGRQLPAHAYTADAP